MARLTVGERIIENIQKSDHGCWIFMRRLDRDGYGRIWDGRAMREAHRVSFEEFIGPIPAGLELDHLCRVRNCVNPEHLEPVTHAENVRRAQAGGREKCGRGHEFSSENTGLQPTGYRFCRICQRAAAHARRARIKAARLALASEEGVK